MNTELLTYLKSKPRYKLAFTDKEIAGFDFIDVGFDLGCAISKRLRRSSLPMFAHEQFQKLLDDNMHIHSEYGKYIAIKNINILFEPQLHLNVQSIIEQNSKDSLFIICNPCTPFKNEFCVWPNHNKAVVDLNDFPYIKFYQI